MNVTSGELRDYRKVASRPAKAAEELNDGCLLYQLDQNIPFCRRVCA
jgi:hypothetical protein